MVTKISLFMINERVDPVAFNKIEAKVSAQEALIETLEKQVTHLKRAVGNFDNLKKDISDLQKQVKAKK